MGTIVTRKRSDGTQAFRAQIILKRDGVVLHQESKTFEERRKANAWMAIREEELSKPEAFLAKVKAQDPPLGEVIDKYIATSRKKIGRTKAQVLAKIKTFPIAKVKCSKCTTDVIIEFAQSLPVKPQTVQNYMSHLRAVFAVARPMWKYPLDPQQIADACAATKRMGITGKSKKRDRRPTIDELNRLMDHFGRIRHHRKDSIEMQSVVPFALFSTRRQEEIVTIRWPDYDPENSRVLVRDMKHPGEKEGNDTWVELPAEAMAWIDSMPRRKGDDRIFPYSTDAVSAAFTRACQFLGIENLHFHDLRHEGISRLFEMGRNIPQVACVSGHRSWQSLQRYTHIRQSGDKYKNWQWRVPNNPGAVVVRLRAKTAA